MMGHRSFHSALIVLAMSGSLHAQQWVVYDMDNSPLPSVTVKSLASDGSGGLWVGTDWGLCHLDGVDEWTIYQEGTSPLVENDVRCLALDGSGRLWIGTVSMGLQVKDGENWTTYTPMNSELPEFGIRDLFIDVADAVWVCTSGGLARFDGTSWIRYDATTDSHDGAVLNTSNTNTVAVREDGAVCLGTFNGGLHFIQGSSVEVLTTFEDGFFDNTAVDVAFHPLTGARWVATPAGGLLRQQGPLVGGLWTQWNIAVGFPSNATTALAFDLDGDVWVGTQIAGLLKVHDDGTYDQFTTSGSGIPDDGIKSLLAGPDGVLWVGTGLGGLARFNPSVDVRAVTRTSKLRAYPNPTRQWLFLELPEPTMAFVWQLGSSDGRLVRQGRSATGTASIGLEGLAPGTYLLRVSSGDLVEVERIVVE